MAIRNVNTQTEIQLSLFSDQMIDTPLNPSSVRRSVRPLKATACSAPVTAYEVRPEEDIERWDGLS